MSVQVSIKKQFVVGILFLLVILSAIEIGTRVYENFNPGCRFLDKEVFKNIDHSLVIQICKDVLAMQHEEPSIKLIKSDAHYPTLNINSFGFRGPEIYKEKSDDMYRIFVVGGSTVVGYGSTSDETTIPGYLQKKIDDVGFSKEVQVINAGVGGAYSFSESYYIKNMLLEFDPDLFIVFDGANDVRYRLLDPEIKNDVTIFDYAGKFLDNPFYRTPIMIYHSVPKEWAMSFLFQPVTEQVSKEVVTQWQQRWSEICELGKEEGFKTIITVQPMVGTGIRTPTSDEFIEWQGQESLEEIKMINAMANSLDELEISCDRTVDLTSVFDGINEPIYFDQVHVTDFGNEIIAQKLFEISLPFIQDSIDVKINQN